jgi:hypothetical protein
MSSQILDAEWVRRIGGDIFNPGVFGKNITTDSQGNVYIIGSYASNPLIVYAIDNTSSAINISNAGSQDTFVVKYDSAGNPQWARHIGGTLNDYGFSIATDSNNNIYVTGGYISTSVNVYSSTNNVDISFSILNSFIGNNDAFIVKYDTNGTAQWGRHIGGIGSEGGYSIAIDSNNNVYVTGSYTSNPFARVYSTNDNSTIAFSIQNTSSTSDAFIVKYDTSGNPLWGRHIGGTSFDYGFSITTDSNNDVYVTGSYLSSSISIFSSETNLDISFVMQNAGDYDAFIVKYSTSGIPQWARHIGNTSQDYGFSIATDSNNNIYVTGQYVSSPVNIYSSINNTDISFTLLNAGSSDAFIVKYNSGGIPQWGRHIGGSNQDSGASIAIDINNNVYVSGVYTSNPLNIYSSSDNSINSFTLLNSGQSDAFMVKYDTDGTALLAQRIGGTLNDFGIGITTDTNGNIYVIGNYESNPLNIYDYTNSNVKFTLENDGTTEQYIVKYSLITPTPPTPTPTPTIPNAICLPRTQIGYLTDNTLENKINIQNNNLMKTNYFSRTYNAKAMSYSDYLKIIQAQTQCNCPN